MALFNKKSTGSEEFSISPHAPSEKQPAGKPKGVSDHTLESAVEMAGLLIRLNGADPSGALILTKCGQIHAAEVARAKAAPDDLARWACEEARNRSPSLDHKEIVAHAMQFTPLGVG